MMKNNFEVFGFLLATLFLFSISFASAELTGLPKSFSPTVGYYHDFSNVRVILWDEKEVYFSSNGFSFSKLSDSDKEQFDIPLNFEPIVGYYHPHGGFGGRVILFGNNNNGLIFPDDNNGDFVFNELDREGEVANGLPVTFEIKAIYVVPPNTNSALPIIPEPVTVELL